MATNSHGRSLDSKPCVFKFVEKLSKRMKILVTSAFDLNVWGNCLQIKPKLN